MKKIFLSLLLLTGSYTLMAQTGNITMAKDSSTMGMTATTYAALPVFETNVPQDMVTKLETKYGSSLYDITTVRSNTPEQWEFVVRVWDNGQYRTDYIGLDGNPVASK